MRRAIAVTERNTTATNKAALEQVKINNERAKGIGITATAAKKELLLATARERASGSNAGIKNTTKELGRQLTYVERLIERAAVYGGIFAVAGFLNNIRQVTSEFELQRVSLAAMLQNATQADKIFEKTVAAAVQSPYQIKEMIQYTKQLAAFGVKNEQLFETTQRLADVSSGLGADFGRISLAYGQIMAKGHLAGTELKQLTELGLAFPEMIAAELTAVEKKAVSVSDVFDRIGKKEIGFDVVSDVFKNLTTDGGRFFEMQAKQAKTLAGLYSNLEDSMSIMYSDIGTEFYDEMRSAIVVVKSLVENWGAVATVAKAAGVAYGLVLINQNKIKASQAKQLFALGEEKVQRYANILATQKQQIEQAKLNSLVQQGINSSSAIYTNKTDDASLLKRAIATKALSKEEAFRAIILGQTTKAERNLMIQTGLLTEVQVANAVSSMGAAKAQNILVRAFNSTIASVKKLGSSFTKLLKGNWITIAIVAIGAVVYDLYSSSIRTAEEVERVTDKFKTLKQELATIDSNENLKGTAQGVDALVQKFKDLGIEGILALKGIELDTSVVEQYKVLSETLENVGINSKLIGIAFAEGFGGVELGGLIGENLESDMKDFNKSLSNLYIAIEAERTLAKVREGLIPIVDKLNGYEKERATDLIEGQRVYETESDYAIRLTKAYVDLSAASRKSKKDYVAEYGAGSGFETKFDKVLSSLTSDQKEALKLMEDAYDEAMGDIGEFGKEIDKRIEGIVSGLNKPVSEMSDSELLDLSLSIKTTFADPKYALNQFAQELGGEMIAERIGIPMDIFATFKAPDIADYNAIQQVLASSEIFKKLEVKQTRNLIDAQKLLRGVLEDELALKEVIAKADKEAYDLRMKAYRDIALEAKAPVQKNLSLAQEGLIGETDTKEIDKITGYIEVQTTALAKLDKQIADTYIPFEDYVTSVKEQLEQAGVESKIVLEMAKALGIVLPSSKGGSDGTDSFVTLIKNRMSVMKDFQSGVQDLNKYLSEEKALSQEQDVMLSRGLSVDIDVSKLKGTAQELSQYYEDTIGMIQAKIAHTGGKQFEEMTVKAILSTDTKNKTIKAYQDLLQYVFNAKTDFDTKTLEQTLKDKLAELNDEIKRQAEAQDFMSSVLGITGNEQMAMDMTVSIYGDVGDGLSESLREQIFDTFQDSGMSSELSSALTKAFSGTNIDTKAIENLLPQVDSEEIKKMLEGVLANANSVRKKELQDLASYLVKVKSYEEERLKIHRDAARQRALIESEGLGVEATEKVNTRESQLVTKLDYETFKSSEAYIAIFKDLSNASVTTLDNLRSTLSGMQEAFKGLDPTQVKELQSRLNEIDAQLGDRNPFYTLKKSLEEYETAYRNADPASLSLDLTSATKEESKAKTAVDESAKLLAQQEEELAQKRAVWNISEITAQQTKIYLTQTELALNNEILADAQGIVAEMLKLLSIQKNIESGWEASFAKITDTASDLIDVGDAAAELVNIFDSDVAESIKNITAIPRAILSSTISIVSSIKGVSEGASVGMTAAAASAAESIKTVEKASVILAIISAALQVATAIANLVMGGQEKKANESIEEQARLIEKLEYQYGRLQKAAEDALGVEYVENYNEQLVNLQAEANAAAKQAQAEKEKGKKEDEEATQAYLDSERDALDQIADMADEFASTVFDTDMKGLAQDISNTWLEAKLAGEDTFDALQNKSKEFVKSMVTDMIMAAAIEASLQPVFDKIDEMRKTPSLAESPEYWAGVAEELSSALGLSDSILEGIFAALEKAGMDLDASSGDLKGISKDAANASEESILGLSAGINTQNSYISGIKGDTAQIVSILRGGGIEMSQGIDVAALITMQNGYLSTLPSIAMNTANTVVACKEIVTVTNDILERLDRVVKVKGSPSIFTLKTEL